MGSISISHRIPVIWYLPTFTMKIKTHVGKYIPYMDPIGTINITLPGKHFATFVSHQLETAASRSFQLPKRMVRFPMFSR